MVPQNLHKCLPRINFISRYASSVHYKSRLLTTASSKKLVNGVDSRGNSDHALVCILGLLGTSRTAFAPQLDHVSCEDFKIVAFDPR